MRLTLALLGGLATLASSSVALAADLIVAEPPVFEAVPLRPGIDWSGHYLGGSIGYGAGSFEGAATEPELSGGFLGLQFGYNVQLGQIVLGLQTDLQLAEVNDTEADGANSIDSFGSTTGRIGYATGNVLPYAKAGLAYMLSTDPVSGATAYSSGWTAGAGLEVAVTQDVSAFAEYNYFAMGENDAGYSPRLQTVKAGLNFGF